MYSTLSGGRLAGLAGLLLMAGNSWAQSTACNNSPDLCERAYNNITYMGAHDSPFLRDDSTDNSPAGNQFLNATFALDAGLRLLQGQVHVENGTLYLCHTSCSLLNGGRLDAWLGAIRFWMDSNPNDVVTLVLVNSDDALPVAFAADFEASGIATYGYAPATADAPTANWPTLRTMIDQETRLVSYITNIDYDLTYPYLLPEFSYVFETEFEVLSLEGFNCSVDRPTALASGPGSAAVEQGYLGLANHFAYKTLFGDIIIPNVDSIDVTNDDSTTTTGALGTHANLCMQEWGVKPNYVLVDFFNRGEVMAAGDALNGVTASVTGRVENDEDSEPSGAAGRFDMGKGFALLAFLAAALAMF